MGDDLVIRQLVAENSAAFRKKVAEHSVAIEIERINPTKEKKMTKTNYPNIDTITKAKDRRFNLSAAGLSDNEINGLIRLEAASFIVNHRHLIQEEFDTCLDFLWKNNPIVAEHIRSLLWCIDVPTGCKSLTLDEEIALFLNLVVNADANAKFSLMYFLAEDNILLARDVFNRLFDFTSKKENPVSNEPPAADKPVALGFANKATSFEAQMADVAKTIELIRIDPMDLAVRTILDAAKDMTNGSQVEVIGGLIKHNRNLAEAVLGKLFTAYKGSKAEFFTCDSLGNIPDRTGFDELFKSTIWKETEQ